MSQHKSTLDSHTTQSHHERDAGLTVTVLWHSELRRIGASVYLHNTEAGQSGLSRTQPHFDDGLPLDHLGASRSPVRILLRGDGVQVLAGKAGTVISINGVPARDLARVDTEALVAGFVLGLGRRGPLLHVQAGLRTPAEQDFGFVGGSQHLAQVRADMSRLGPLPFPVLIRGETGTGKELVAAGLHQAGGRAGHYVAINLAALPPSMAASQLFGHARGAFTGADRAAGGYFGDAEGGTLLLDEIGAAPPDLQAQLLRALESGEVQPVGARPRKVNVRVLAATDEDLELAIAEGRFRRPLLHRVAHGRIHLLPLRRRPCDIAAQFAHFAQGTARTLHGMALPPDWLQRKDMQRLLRHPWPGNTRELRGVAEQCAATSGAAARCRLPTFDLPAPPEPDAVQQAPLPPQLPGDDQRLLQCLQDNSWRMKPTAAQLGIGRNTLKRRMVALGIPRAAELSADTIQSALASQGSLAAAAWSLRVSERGLAAQMRALGLA